MYTKFMWFLAPNWIDNGAVAPNMEFESKPEHIFGAVMVING